MSRRHGYPFCHDLSACLANARTKTTTYFQNFSRFIIRPIVAAVNTYIRNPQAPGDGFNWLIKAVGPINDPNIRPVPSRLTAMVSIVSFIVSLVVGACAVIYPVSASPYFTMGVMFSLAFLLATLFVFDILRARCNRKTDFRYRRNLGNTVCTIILSLVALPVLYRSFWYPALNLDVINMSKDTVDQVYFPSITLLQRSDWSSQAELTLADYPPKCFLGWYQGDSPECDTISQPGSQLPCKCERNWDSAINERFVWKETTYRTLTLTASESMTCLNPTTLMIAQAWFYYNSSQVLADAGRVLSPSLWVAIFDPTLTLTEALENGYTQMQLVNANGMVAINLGLQYRQAPGKALAYDYDVFISPTQSETAPFRDGASWITLFVQFPTFDRQISALDKAMHWQDTVAAAGGLFSFLQILGWLVSGLAIQF